MARPRSTDAHRRALDAAAVLVAERGVEGLTVEEVSARSGVAKTTIYRHWPTRHELVVDALQACVEEIPAPDTGDLRRDLVAFFGALRDASTDRRPMLVALLHAAQSDPELARLHQAALADRRRTILTPLHRAVERGELPEGLDLDLVVDQLVGPLLFRSLFRGEPVSERQLARIVDVVVTGLQASSAATAH